MGSTQQQNGSENLASPSEVDRSCRWPVLYLFAAAIGWLILGLVFGVAASIKSHAPGFLASCAYVGYGRIHPAFLNLVLYGFAAQAGLGAALWMAARLGRTPVALPGVAALGGVVWNAGITYGLVQILFGQTTGFQWMEFPRQAAALLAGGFFLIAVSLSYTIHERRVRDLFISHWFLIAALLAFPWLLTAGYFLTVVDPLRGVMQSLAAAWYANGVQYLVLTPLGMAVAYYLLPKATGRPVHSNQAAALGFWTLVVFGSWTGPSLLAGGPFPRWILGLGQAAKFLMILPALAYATNYYLTRSEAKSPSKIAGGSFLGFATLALVLHGLLDATSALPSVAQQLQLTPFTSGVSLLWLFGFVAMILLAGIYYITERLVDAEWLSSGLIRGHFILSVLGVVLVVGGYLLGGWSFGGSLADPTIAFAAASKSLAPTLGMATLGLTLLALGQVLFALNFVRTVIAATAEARAEFCTWCCGCATGVGDKKAKARA